MAIRKARSVGAVLLVAREMPVVTGADHTKTIPLLERQAQKENLPYALKSVEVFIPQSANGYEYSDSLGGDISYFERYQSLEDAVVVG
ncbi:hypothetical protein HYS95_02500 [Candidatus Daviesbacteria bacterium]|nr:hypothetical protein [Candidatus Daviesbacteria bacterium]